MEEGERGRCEDGVAVNAKEGGNSEEVVFEDVVGAEVVRGGDRGEGDSATGGGGHRVGSPPAWERVMGGTSWEEQRWDMEGKVEARKRITEAPLSHTMGESLGRTLARI